VSVAETATHTMQDDLSTPLGAKKPVLRKRQFRVTGRHIVPGVVVLMLASLGAFALLVKDPLGGQPVAVSQIIRVQPNEGNAPAVATASAAPAADESKTPARMQSTAAEMEAESGVKVVRQGGASAPGSVVIRVPDVPTNIRLAAAPDKRLVEKGRHGNIPRIGTDGARPLDVYARPVTVARSGRPRIAIFVGGLGVGQSATTDAIAKLPGAVTLAFAPYGNDLERHVARARDEGHEILLQVPMEPFDYPDNDPGPQTLLTGLTPEQNVDRLHWLMSRFPGFIGVTTFMGGKLTASEQTLAPILREVGARGLALVDDGTSARSLTMEAAAAQGVASARADIVLDATSKTADIDAALGRLETAARVKGSAVGFATALPVSVERLARWAKSLDQKGIDLVPVSALISAAKRAS
jgi:uncharacterized protein